MALDARLPEVYAAAVVPPLGRSAAINRHHGGRRGGSPAPVDPKHPGEVLTTDRRFPGMEARLSRRLPTGTALGLSSGCRAITASDRRARRDGAGSGDRRARCSCRILAGLLE